MKINRPNPQNNYLFYSQQQDNQPQPKNPSSSGYSRPKLITKRSQLISQNLAQYSLKDIKTKARNFSLDFLEKVLIIQNMPGEISNKVEAIATGQNINEIFDLVFTIIADSVRQNSKKSEHKQSEILEHREKQLTFAIRSKQAKLLRLIKQDQTASERISKGKTSRKIEQCQKVNQSLKKELFSIKEQKQALEKKIANLVEEFQSRKTFYLAQIKKLTEIIKMSSVDVRNLVLQKTKQAKKLHSKSNKDNLNTQQVQSELQIPENHNERSQNSPRAIEKNNHQHSIASFNGYNTEIRIMKHISSIQNYQEQKIDSYINF